MLLKCFLEVLLNCMSLWKMLHCKNLFFHLVSQLVVLDSVEIFPSCTSRDELFLCLSCIPTDVMSPWLLGMWLQNWTFWWKRGTCRGYLVEGNKELCRSRSNDSETSTSTNWPELARGRRFWCVLFYNSSEFTFFLYPPDCINLMRALPQKLCFQHLDCLVNFKMKLEMIGICSLE